MDKHPEIIKKTVRQLRAMGSELAINAAQIIEELSEKPAQKEKAPEPVSRIA